ncbi:hypothetical protein CVD28_18555 [Bacillus sp. M6-12]|uniref:DUF1259 domain-containing protein n=1 Tax=Bacillus sp. M6-12 TaxID=2054166 RepID=UPI000C76F58E|nr:DUF1259 domain-containing protein [Bacillus sp. M6-12]PLS16051.1 hypothetical protein CVD28_18555 [Bacillus sp. M6-12]
MLKSAVPADHNHWLFDTPLLMYMQWVNVGDPFEFARNSIEAARKQVFSRVLFGCL